MYNKNSCHSLIFNKHCKNGRSYNIKLADLIVIRYFLSYSYLNQTCVLTRYYCIFSFLHFRSISNCYFENIALYEPLLYRVVE